MKKMVNDWADKQGILRSYKVKGKLTEEQISLFLGVPNRTQVIEILEKYNDLLKEEYQDSDLWDIISQTTDKFLLKYYPKID